MSKMLGELLIADGVINQVQVDQALVRQRFEKKRLGQILIEKGLVAPATISRALSKQHGVPAVDLDKIQMDESALKLVNQGMAERHLVLPLSREGANLTLAMAHPDDPFARDDIRFATGYNIVPVVACEHAMHQAIVRVYSDQNDKGKIPGDFHLSSTVDKIPRQSADALPPANLALAKQPADPSTQFPVAIEKLVDGDLVPERRSEPNTGSALPQEILSQKRSADSDMLLDELLREMMSENAESMHLSQTLEEALVLFRGISAMRVARRLPIEVMRALLEYLDGLRGEEAASPAIDTFTIQRELGSALNSRVFRIAWALAGEGVRVSIHSIGTSEDLSPNLSKLGLDPKQYQVLIKQLDHRRGALIVTGPWNTGKQRFIYSCLQRYSNISVHTVVAEAYPAFQLKGATFLEFGDSSPAWEQMKLFSPDQLHVGEIADPAAGRLCLEAGMDGVRAFGSLPAADTVSAYSLLRSMPLPAHAIAFGIAGILALRNVRRICKNCARLYRPAEGMLEALGLDETMRGAFRAMRGEGCGQCDGSGFAGTITLFEYLPWLPPIKECALNNGNPDQLKEIAIGNGMITLRRNGIQSIRQGLTTIDDILRLTEGA